MDNGAASAIISCVVRFDRETIMRLLFLTARLPYPPNRGDRLRAYHFIRELSREHRITLLSFVADDAEGGLLAGLRPYCESIQLVHLPQHQSVVGAARGLWKRESLQSLYYHSPHMQRAVDELVAANQFDAVYVHLFRMAQYVRRHSSLYRIVDLTDVISTEIARSLPYRDAFWRAVYRVELPRIQKAELGASQTANETWVISEAERRALSNLGATGPIEVIPNGIDVLRFHPTGQHKAPNTLIFVGHMGVLHNIDAAEHLARDILPLVRRDIPNAQLNIVGAEPGERVRQLDSLPGVHVLGHVANLNAALNDASLFVAPLRFAAGVQNKVLEAMAAGLAVVTTSCVNEGLAAEAERDLVIAEGAEPTAAAIVSLLRNKTQRDTLGKAGRAYVTSSFSWNHATERMRAIARLRSHAQR